MKLPRDLSGHELAKMLKRRYWQRTIGEAARSGMSIREFCRQGHLKESQFYWWQRKLKADGPGRKRVPGVEGDASFALVSEEAGSVSAGLELVLRDGRRVPAIVPPSPPRWTGNQGWKRHSRPESVQDNRLGYSRKSFP